jgi:spore maturation protein CgeB
MTGQESTDEKIKRLEHEIRELKATKEAASRREELLVKRLKEYETSFYKELNAQVRIYKKSWTWRIGRLFVGPAEWFLSLFRLRKKRVDERTARLKNPGQSMVGVKSSERKAEPDFNYQASDPTKYNIAVIFDTFTQSCFSPEFNTICFTPSNWKKVLESAPLDGLFIESAWRGFGDTWKDKIAHISGGNQAEVIKLVDWAKEHNLPLIFWNKEDPVHFGQFIGLAKKFDYIFTTDADCIPDYQKYAPKAIINSLPFAAQPKLHNPIVETQRNKSVCFAGTYYDQRYHERKADMDLILKPSLGYGLEIFDRHYGNTSKTAGNFRFPDIYQEAIKGKLDYDEMVKAYKQYKVFLNVNSVKYSPTMFARRVFELLASGTPVISTFSQGVVNILGEGTVFISESEEDTKNHLEYLLGNEQNWWKASLNGLRKVMEHHTYEDRTRNIFDIIGLNPGPEKSVKFSVFSKVSTMEEILLLEKMLRHQHYKFFDVVLCLVGEEINPGVREGEISSLFAPFAVKLFNENSQSLETDLLACSDSTHVAFFNSGKYYGPNYLRDYALAVKYSNAGIMGKKSFYLLEQGEKVILSEKGFEFQYVMKVPNATSVHRKANIDPARIRDYLKDGFIFTDEPMILSIDPYNYLSADFPIKQGVLPQDVLNNIEL